jgi:uncharacterized membrane protein
MKATRRAAWILFALHAGMILFSTAAMVTVLAGPASPGSSPVDVTTEPAATIMRVSFRFAGPTYVVLGALAALSYLASAVGWKASVLLAATASALALGAELAGTSTGLPFGDYAYSGLLGYRILGLVPFPIPLSWFYMLAGALAIVARLSRPGARHSSWTWALGAGALMVAWDLSMDPAMVKTGHWLWGRGSMFHDAGLPAWLESFFTADAFYGMPVSNWFGWFLTAALIARVMLAIVPPQLVGHRVASSSLLIALYLANGIMPVALCLRDGLWWAAALGAIAMLVPAVIAWRGLAARQPLGFSAQPT